MDTGPPAKRVRVNSGSRSNGHGEPYGRDQLPPMQYPPPHAYPRPAAQVPPHLLDSHRHHEPDYPTPVQDIHRLHSVAPPAYHNMPFSAPGPRDPVVKRDPSDDASHVNAARPHSTGDINQDHARPPPLEDHRRQSVAGYDGLNAPPLSQPYRNAPPYAIPPHQPSNTMYDRYDPPPTPGGSYPPGLSYTGSSSSNNQRKKAPRTSQACAQCRAAKGKCDDPKPCSSCREKKLDCDWKPPEPKHGDLVQQKMQETMLQILEQTEAVPRMVNRMENRMEKKIDKLQRAMATFIPDLEAQLKTEEEIDDDMAEIELPPLSAHRSIAARRSSSPEEVKYEQHLEIGNDYDSAKNDTDEDETGKPVMPDEPAIPVGHTTGAARLLLWPSIKAMIGDFMRDEKISEEYAFLKEMKNGIQLYGTGPNQAPSPDYTGEDAYSDLQSPSPADDGAYGPVAGDTPPPSIQIQRDTKGGMRPDGTLDLPPAAVERLIESYMKNIHIMHPILHPKDVEKMAKSIQRKESAEITNPKISSAGFVSQHGEATIKKQKHSPRSISEYSDPATSGRHVWKPSRSIKTAVFLLVLALGKISEHKERLPNVLSEDDKPPFDSPSLRKGFPPSVQASPTISSKSSGLPSPQEGDRGSRNLRRTSVDGQGRQRGTSQIPRQNADVIPGLAYAEFATGLIGNHNGEHSLEFVHACTLAGLYFGQLVRPVRSQLFIQIAGVHLLNLLRSKNEKLKEIKYRGGSVETRDNNLVFAFWTLLQLESDIVAELDVVQSGISNYEAIMPWPNTNLAKELGQLNERQARSYDYQLFLRKHLNNIHSEVYGPGKDEAYKLSANFQATFPTLDAFLDTLPKSEGWGEFSWKEGDAPATDILAARLRAKYYGVYVITYRPFLMMVMNRDEGVEMKRIPEHILVRAKACIDAMINSTKSFHGMPPGQRIIITNVWGTAHAQWGNVLALLAAYRDPFLRDYINPRVLKALVQHIIKFLRELATPRSSLVIDIKILERAARMAGIYLDTPGTSFSSATPGLEGTPQPPPSL